MNWVRNEHKNHPELLETDAAPPPIILFLVPPLNIALTSSQAKVTSSGGFPRSLVWRRQELKLAASGWTYLSLSASLEQRQKKLPFQSTQIKLQFTARNYITCANGRRTCWGRRKLRKDGTLCIWPWKKRIGSTTLKSVINWAPKTLVFESAQKLLPSAKLPISLVRNNFRADSEDSTTHAYL